MKPESPATPEQSGPAVASSDWLPRHVVAINTWAGKRTYPVKIVGETKMRYRVTAFSNMMLPGRRFVPAGRTVLVPKYAVKEGKPTEYAGYEGHVYGYAG